MSISYRNKKDSDIETRPVLTELQKEVLEKTEIMITKDDPILIIVGHSQMMVEQAELRLTKLLGEYSDKLDRKQTRNLNMIDADIRETANQFLGKIDSQIDKSLAASMPAYQHLLLSAAERVEKNAKTQDGRFRAIQQKLDELALWLRISVAVSAVSAAALAAAVLGIAVRSF